MQSTDLRGDRDLDRDEETERDRFLNSATLVSEYLLIVMIFPGSCVATYMGEFNIARNDSIRVSGGNRLWSSCTSNHLKGSTKSTAGKRLPDRIV